MENELKVNALFSWIWLKYNQLHYRYRSGIFLEPEHGIKPKNTVSITVGCDAMWPGKVTKVSEKRASYLL